MRLLVIVKSDKRLDGKRHHEKYKIHGVPNGFAYMSSIIPNGFNTQNVLFNFSVRQIVKGTTLFHMLNPTNKLIKHFIISSFLIFCMFTSYAANKRALLIGISDYPSLKDRDAEWGKIHGANDALMIQGTLKSQGFKTTMLINKDATASNIRQAFKKLQYEATPGDLIYIHFSGHGQPVEDKNGDESDGWDEAIIPYDAQSKYSKKYKGQNHILDDELEILVNSIREKIGSAGFVYVILDACHMGGASRDESETEEELYIRGTNRGFSSRSKLYVPKIDRSTHMKVKADPKLGGICYMEACRSYQTNAEIKENNSFYGPLTFYVNQSLKLVALSKNFQWTNSVVKEMAKDKRLIKQNPVIESDR